MIGVVQPSGSKLMEARILGQKRDGVTVVAYTQFDTDQLKDETSQFLPNLGI